MDLRQLAPSVDEIAALPLDQRAQRIQAVMQATLQEVASSPARQREWLAAWRHFMDEWEARGFDNAGLVPLVQTLLDVAEKALRAQW